MMFKTLTILCLLTITLTQASGPYADLFTSDQYDTIQNKRIRREIRDLSDDEWNAVANAMNIMKNTPTAQGRLLYGDTYFSYDDLVCQHARGTYSVLGDLSHSGPQFNIWHRAFVLSFENILISIDPSIQGVPYWDYRIDVNEQNSNYDMTNSVIFSDKYLGEYSTVNDENKNYAVKTGKFAYWPINTNASVLEFECGDKFRNAFGFLRKKTNPEHTPYFTRFGGYSCGEPRSIGNLEIYDRCLNDESLTEYEAFHDCYDGAVHGSAHNGVGGTRLSYDDQIQSAGCRAFAGGAIFVEQVRIFALHHGCYSCHTPGFCSITAADPFECGACNYSSLVQVTPRGTLECRNEDEGLTFRMNGIRDELQVVGDFVDQVTSPNDPIFMFHHANVDRYLMEWQIRHYAERPYYHHPTTGWQVGVNLNDIITPEAPFTNLFNDPDSEPYSHADIWDGTEILVSPYTYDTILDLIDPSIDSPTNSPTDLPTPQPTDLCACYATTLISERIRSTDGARCYRYEVDFCDDGPNSMVLGRGSSSRRSCGVESYQDVIVSVNVPAYVTYDADHIGVTLVSGLKLDNLLSGDRFGICFDDASVSGTQSGGNIEYLTDSMDERCPQADTLPDLCGGTIAAAAAEIVEKKSAEDQLATDNQSKGAILGQSVMAFIWGGLCAVYVGRIAV